ncbi:MAG: uroporphyrinogen-III synthase [Pseudomonadota bacterium]
MTNTRRRILVTRPEPAASKTAEALEAEGYDPVVVPLFEIKPMPGVDSVVEKVLRDDPQAIAFTSANAIRALMSSFTDSIPQTLLQLPVYALGEATAIVSRDAGFATVLETPPDHGGDAKGLAAWITSRCEPGGGPILHLHGQHRAADLSVLLAGPGLQVTARAIYVSQSAEPFTDSLRQHIANAPVVAVLHYSPRAARHFVERAAEIRIPCHACLSPAVAEALDQALIGRKIGAGSVVVAELPNERALLRALKQSDRR